MTYGSWLVACDVGLEAVVVFTLLIYTYVLPLRTRINRRHRGFTINIGKNVGLGDMDFSPSIGRGGLVNVGNNIATQCVSRGCFDVVYNTRVRLGFSRRN